MRKILQHTKLALLVLGDVLPLRLVLFQTEKKSQESTSEKIQVYEFQILLVCSLKDSHAMA